MDRHAPSDVELLGMAGEVLDVCDRSLKDIIEDLTMTRSSELTINRIFDGQFLTPLVTTPTSNVPAFKAPENLVMLLSSSEDADSENEDFLYHLGESSRTVGPDEASLRSNVQSETSGKRSPSPLVSVSQRSPRSGTSGRWNTPKVAMEDSGSDAEETRTDFQTSATTKEEAQVIIDLHTTPTRTARRMTRKFQLVSPSNQSAFSDWDYELITLPRQGDGPPTIMLSSPFSSSKKGDIDYGSRLPLARTSDDSASEENFSVTTELGSEKLPSLQSQKSSSRITTSPTDNSPPLRLTKLMHSSRKGSPNASDLLARTAHFDNILAHTDPSELPRKKEVVAASIFESSDERKHWEYLIDTTLSPPSNPFDELDDSEMEHMMSDVTGKGRARAVKKREFSRSSSSKSLGNSVVNGQKGKKRDSASMVLDLEDWDDELLSTDAFSKDVHHPGESLSLEEEIMGRAKQRQKRTKPGSRDEIGDTSDDGTAISAAEARKAAQAAQREAREADKAAKKLVRDQELQRRRLAKDEERQEEKKAARQLRIANRLTTKSEGAKEMMLCIEETLYHSSFGLTLQDYLAPIECQISLVPLSQAEKSTRVNDTDVSPIRDLIFWRRIVGRRFDEEQHLFVPLVENEVELELFTLVYVTANDFAGMIQDGCLKDTLATVKRDMKLRRNKERLKMSSVAHHETLRLKEDRSQRQRVIFLIAGLEGFLRGLRKATTKRFQQAVLASLHRGTVQGGALLTTATEEESVVDENRIEQEMLWLQLEQDCLIIHSNDEDESAQAVVSLTEQIGLRPYKDVHRTGLNVCVEGIRSGIDASDTWIKSLQEIHMVTHLVAKSIAQEYPSIKSLYEGYRQCESAHQAQLMLEGTPVIGRRSTIGRAVSRRIYDVFMSEDPDKPVC